MDKKIKKKWLTALTDGSHRQTKSGYLHVKDSKGVERFCILGVLADVLGVEWEEKPSTFCKLNHKAVFRLKDNNFYSSNYLSGDLLSKCKLSASEAGHLMEMNDDGKTFKTLAKYIEENL